MAIRLAMGFWTALKVISLDTTLEPLTFAGTHHIDVLAYHKGCHRHRIAFFDQRVFDTKFTQKAQRGQVVALEMSHLTTGKTFRIGLFKTQLYGRITILFWKAHLGYITWPSFDK